MRGAVGVARLATVGEIVGRRAEVVRPAPLRERENRRRRIRTLYRGGERMRLVPELVVADRGGGPVVGGRVPEPGLVPQPEEGAPPSRRIVVARLQVLHPQRLVG